MTLAFRRSHAPQATSAGALRVGCRAIGLVLAGALMPCLASGQEPDTIQVPDSVPPPISDSVPPPISDSLQQVLDSLATVVDSLSRHVDVFPRFPSGVAPSWESGVWTWDRADLASNRAITLAELVSQVPGVIALKGGDYGTPRAAVAFGAAGGRVRVIWDGFEWVPLDGGVADLSRIGLGGLDEVRVERQPGELRIEIRTTEPSDAEPITNVDVGTGDLGTNLLRGVLAHPNTLGGALTFSLDRLETRGPALDAAGSLSGVGLRYAVSRGSRGGLSAELRRFVTKTDVKDFPADLTRNDWNVRGRWRLTDGLTVEALWGASSLSGNAEDPSYNGLDASRSQLAFRAGYQRGWVWGDASTRFLGGDGVPDGVHEAAVGGSYPRVLSVDGSLRLEWWPGQSALSWRARAITAPVLGLSLFVSREEGESGVPFVPRFEEYLRSLEPEPVDPAAPPSEPEPSEPDPAPEDPPPLERPVVALTERSAMRAGATFRWRSLSLSGSWLSMETDSLRPLGLLLDRDAVALEGGKRTGYELSASLPLPITGFRVEGAVQSWDEEHAYLPRQTWDGSITYHRVFKESRNLELWGTLGVTGRESMLLPIVDPDPPVDDPPDVPEDSDANPDDEPAGPPLLRVPLYRELFTQIQVRIVSVSIFVRWENLAGKPDNLDFPGRQQPRLRTLYGVRWTMNN